MRKMDDKIDEILDLLKSQNEMIKDIRDYVAHKLETTTLADVAVK